MTVPTPEPSATQAAQSGDFSGDTIAPVTVLNLTGVINSNNEYLSGVICTLTARDNEGGSGLYLSRYSFNGTDWYDYTGPFLVSTPGMTSLYYGSVDNAGNAEILQAKGITITGGASATSMIEKTPALSMVAILASLMAGSMLVLFTRKRKPE